MMKLAIPRKKKTVSKGRDIWDTSKIVRKGPTGWETMNKQCLCAGVWNRKHGNFLLAIGQAVMMECGHLVEQNCMM